MSKEIDKDNKEDNIDKENKNNNDKENNNNKNKENNNNKNKENNNKHIDKNKTYFEKEDYEEEYDDDLEDEVNEKYYNFNPNDSLGVSPFDIFGDESGIDYDDLMDKISEILPGLEESGAFEDMNNIMPHLSFKISKEDFEDFEKMDQKNRREDGNDRDFGYERASKFNKNERARRMKESANRRAKLKKQREKKNATKNLDTFGTLLNDEVKAGKIDPVIGRDEEIDRMIQILNRRTKNNPCLIGEPGVGKTAIAQGLAYRIENGQIPAKLMNTKIYLLDMGTLVAGTQFRGQFEARIKGILEEVKNNKNIILVIDEIHTIVGSGDGENSTNISNILKPALAAGDVQLIGTTTLNEYRRYIEKDKALERRFQPILVEEPNLEETIKILKGIKKYYEEFHFVKVSDSMIEKIVQLSEKYVHDRFLPDKAIDILDEAASLLNLKNVKLYRVEYLRHQLKKIEAEKEERVELDSTEDYKMAAELKAKELRVREELEELEKTIKPLSITLKDVAEVIERWTSIPVSKITEAEAEKLLNLEGHLHERIIGQEEAVEVVSRAIRRKRAGLQTDKRPPSFLFVGPTGVGKTELAKTLAEEVYGSKNNMIRIDMSEYMEKYSVSKLIGAAPGYVGFEDTPPVLEQVRHQPYSIVLFDEIEKAHPEIFNILLQILEDGFVTDTRGTKINFDNTIVIMTSNAGSELNANLIGFGNEVQMQKDKTLEAVKETFRPEFLNRIDEIVVFDSLTEDELVKIVDLFIKDTDEVLKEKNIKMTVTEDAKKYIVSKGTDLKYGARPLRRAVQRLIDDELSDLLLSGELKDGMNITVDKSDIQEKEKKKIKITNEKKKEKKQEEKQKQVHAKAPENLLMFSLTN